MDRIEILQSPDVAEPRGHYSQGIGFADLIFVSGQLPVLGDGSHDLPSADFQQQARQAYANLLGVLRAGGATPADVLKVTIYIADMADWPECDRLHAEIFGASRPARAVVPTGPLHYGYKVEIDAIARRPTSERSPLPEN